MAPEINQKHCGNATKPRALSALLKNPISSVVSGPDFPSGREIVTQHVTSCHRTESGLIPPLAGKDLTQLRERTFLTRPK